MIIKKSHSVELNKIISTVFIKRHQRGWKEYEWFGKKLLFFWKSSSNVLQNAFSFAFRKANKKAKQKKKKNEYTNFDY